MAYISKIRCLENFCSKLDGDQHFRQLAFDGFLRREEKTTRKLHGQGRSALRTVAVQDISTGRFHQAKVIHSAVLEKAAVLNGDHRIHQIVWNLVEGDNLAFRAVRGTRQRGNQLGLEFVGRQGLTVATVGSDRTDFAAGEADGHILRSVKRLLTGQYVDGSRCQVESPNGGVAVLAVLAIARAP